MAPAAFGQSSLGQIAATQPAHATGFGSAARTFGTAKIDHPSGSSAFKSLIGTSQPQTNAFLASGADKVDDNEMADEEDIFGGGQPVQPSTGFGAPSPFGAQPTGFGQPSGGTLQSSLGFDPKSNPSFTQRRK